ncbi:DNA primase [candidate division WOR-3 bacterium]|nr:DNA primase [candidate division WOR-3 bacterium]
MKLKDRSKAEEILEKIQIADVIAEYVKLTPSGKDLKGLCPFHTEKTPSFTVSPQKNLFYCFGCGAGGNAYNFLMRIENIDFPEALRRLAKRAGVSLSDSSGAENELYKVMEFACSYYQKCLKKSAGENLKKYLSFRGLDAEITSKFRIGYSERGLYPEAKKAGFSVKTLEKAGLINIKKNVVSEVFFNRLMFPISDASGRIIAFGGRSLDSREPKYLNSRQIDIYDKSSVLYSLHNAKKAAQKASGFILVEGYMDAISMFRAGFENAIASCGTSLTFEQAKTIKKYSDRVSIFYDSDESGKRATSRGIEILIAAGLDVDVIDLKTFKDPDELVQKSNDPRKEIEESKKNWLDYMIDVKNYNTPAEKSKLSKRVIEIIQKIPDPILREEWKRKASTSLGIPEIDGYFSKTTDKLKSNEDREISKKEHILLMIYSTSLREDSTAKLAKNMLSHYLNKEKQDILVDLAKQIENKIENSSLKKEYFKIRFNKQEEALQILENLKSMLDNLVLREKRDELINNIKTAQQKGEDTRDLAFELEQLVREGRKR